MLPFLQKEFNPKILETLANSLESISEDSDFLKQCTSTNWNKNSSLSVKNVQALHPAIQKRLILEAVICAKNDLKNITSSHIREIMKIVSSTKNKRQIVTLKGLKVSRAGDKLRIEKKE